MMVLEDDGGLAAPVKHSTINQLNRTVSVV